MLWTIVAVLLILWLLGFSLHVAGGLILAAGCGAGGCSHQPDQRTPRHGLRLFGLRLPGLRFPGKIAEIEPVGLLQFFKRRRLARYYCLPRN